MALHTGPQRGLPCTNSASCGCTGWLRIRAVAQNPPLVVSSLPLCHAHQAAWSLSGCVVAHVAHLSLGSGSLLDSYLTVLGAAH